MKRDYDFVIKNIEHYKALGQDTVYIDDYADYRNNPWDKAEGVEKGCLWRMDIPVSVTFYAMCEGVKIVWSFDLEDRSADGSTIYKFDRARINWVFHHLPPDVKKKFVEYLEQTVYFPICKMTENIYDNFKRNQETELLILDLIRLGRN